MDRPLAGAAWLGSTASRAVLAALTARGGEARFVGGCVRDALLDSAADPADLDLATAELPETVIELCAVAGLRTIPTGLRHGTVTVLAGKRSFEVTTLRRDLACDGRHAEVLFTDSFEADAARRDFTINAMSCDPKGAVFDYFEGRADLAAGRVRFVGDPHQRIEEDYLRILRFFRFFARFGRGEPDEPALRACAALAHGIDRLSGERVRGELLRLLVAPRAEAALLAMHQTGVLARVLPGAPDVEALARLRTLTPADPLLALALLLRGSRSDAAAAARITERLRLSNEEAERLRLLTTAELPDLGLAPDELSRAFYITGAELHLDLARLRIALEGADPARLDAATTLAASWQRPAFPLTGDDLLERGVPPGPELGRLLKAVRDWWVRQGFTPDRAACLAYLDRCMADRSP